MPEVMEKEKANALESGNQVEAAPKSKKGKKRLFIIISVELASIMLAFFVVNNLLKPRIPEWYVPETKPAEEVSSPGAIMTISDLIVNPAGSGGTRYLSVSMGIEVKDEVALKEVQLREPVIRDALINILSGETVEQLSAPEEKNLLRNKIALELNGLMKSIEIRNVYFINYVLQ